MSRLSHGAKEKPNEISKVRDMKLDFYFLLSFCCNENIAQFCLANSNIFSKFDIDSSLLFCYKYAS